MDLLSWFVNIGAAMCWMINIKNRKYAMVGFTVVTCFSIWYFAATKQVPFVLRSIFYLCVDIATLWHIVKKERHHTTRNGDPGLSGEDTPAAQAGSFSLNPPQPHKQGD